MAKEFIMNPVDKVLYLAMVTVICLFLASSCVSNYENKFKNFIICNSWEDCLETNAYLNDEFMKMAIEGKNNISFLVKKALSDKKTNCTICPLPFILEEGDVAILLLVEICKFKNGDFMKLFPNEINNSIKKHGILAWLKWLQIDKKNRSELVAKIKQRLMTESKQIIE